MTHYETLDVAKDATPQEIKRAYRAKAKNAHPDKGGKQSDFEPIVKAYEVLKDPERRLLYDATGQDQQTPIETAAQSLLLQLFNQALAAEDDLPLVRTVQAQLKTAVEKIPDTVEQLKARKKKLEAKRKKVRTKKGVANAVHMIIDGQLTAIAGNVLDLEREIEVAKVCLKQLASYSEDWDPPVRTEPSIYFYPSGATVGNSW